MSSDLQKIRESFGILIDKNSQNRYNIPWCAILRPSHFPVERKHNMSHWIRADETPSAPRFYYFEKEFDAPKGATLKASSCGDTRYVLYLNGHLVSEGPCQGSQYVTYYETEDLTPYLVEGKNKLTAKVLYVTEGWFISVYRRMKGTTPRETAKNGCGSEKQTE